MKSVVVVGSINMDLVLRAERMPNCGETLKGYAFYQAAGGKGANQAVAVARLGDVTVQMIGCVGSDEFGRRFLHDLKQEGIRIEYLRTLQGLTTGVASIWVDESGNNSILLAAGANDSLSAAHIEDAQDIICAADILICQLETPLDAVQRAIELAHLRGVPVILNPAPICELSSSFLAMVDILILNEVEASEMTNLPVKDPQSAHLACERLLKSGVKTVLLTMGAQGVQVSTDRIKVFIPALVVKAVDTTAAGDAFVAAFSVQLLEGQDVVAAASWAQYAAALTVTREGAQPAIAYRQEVEVFISQYKNI